MSGKLIVGSMHIGHHQDLSYRMVDAMRESQIIYTDYMPDNLYKALELYGIKADERDIRILKSTNTLFADDYQIQEVIDFIKEGRTVLLVAGEGQIGMADPGVQFIQACIDNQLPYTVYPGPSAYVSAFVAAGIVNSDFFISANMEHPEKTIEYFKDQDNALVIPIWDYKLNGVLDVLDQKFKFTNGRNKKATFCIDMTTNEEEYITDWVDQIAKNDRLRNLRPHAKLMLVISDFIKQ